MYSESVRGHLLVCLLVCLVVCLANAVACGDDSSTDAGLDPDGGVDSDADAGAVAVFDRASLPDLTSVPFPSDLYRDERGVIRLGEVPGLRGGSDTPAFDAIRRLASLRDGFCTTCAITFAIQGALDVESVPVSATPFDSASVDDPIVLMDVDADSPERGSVVPLRVHYGSDRIAVRPVPGVVLARNRTYAAVLTDAIRAIDGSALAASPDFLAYDDPALDTLDELGVSRERIVSAAVFTTGDPSRELVRVRELTSAPDGLTVDRVWRDAELDALLGIPADSGPGIDAPSTGEGTRAIGHETTLLVVSGTFEAPRLVTGEGTEVGVPRRNPDGELEAGPLEPVPFLLIVPRDAQLDALPLVVSLHGFNSSRVVGFALAETAGRAGAAVLSIDYYQHGARAASAVDERHAMRDLDGADGLPETSEVDVSARVFGLIGVEPGTELSPEYSLGSLLQFVSDALATLDLAREGDLGALRSIPELDTLAFDPERIFVVGNSLGAEVTSMVASVDRDAAGIVLNVIPGSIVDNLVESAEFRPITETLFLPRLGLVGPFREPARGLDMDLVIDLFRFALESVDPLALAPFIVRPDGPDVLVQLGGLDEVASRRSGEAMVAAMGIPAAPALTLASTPTASPPVRANLNGVSALASFLGEGGHGMMEVRTQESRCVPPALPPHELRAEPIRADNPIGEVHAGIEAMIRSGGTAERATLQ